MTYRFTFTAMACPCELVLEAETDAAADQHAKLAMTEVRRIEHKYSRYREDSVVSTINSAAGQGWVDCDAETLALLAFAEQMHQQSGGLFDITSGVLRHAWRFAERRLPEPAAVQALLPLIGWHHVDRRAQAVRLPQPGMELDFGGFGKEYAADRAAATLQASGVVHGYVNLGGDVRLVGPRPDGSAWVMGIQHPRESHRVLATQQLQHGALATSGDYERCMVVQGQHYGHVLHPRTGWPVKHWQSVSVTAPQAVLAGCISTIAMLKEGDGLAFLQASGCRFLAVDAAGQIHHN